MQRKLRVRSSRLPGFVPRRITGVGGRRVYFFSFGHNSN
jgi:hypothetical protein